MSTQIADKPKRVVKRKRYVVTLDGIACGLSPYDKSVIGWRLIPKRGVLVKKSESPTVFPGPRSAQHAIDSAIKLRAFYRTDVVEVAPAHRHLVEHGTFKVVLHEQE